MRKALSFQSLQKLNDPKSLIDGVNNPFLTRIPLKGIPLKG
jgi:hypothetical protein